MGADQNLDWRQAAASALDWWRDAGVDVVVEDAAFNWLAAPEPLAMPAFVEAREPLAPPPAALPASLADFASWRVGADMPEARWRGPAILGHGPDAATLMVLVDCPERGDREALLEGECGKLFDRMLAAIGRSRADVMLAAVCTRRPTTGRVPRDVEQRLGEIARHHVGLAAPACLLTLGDAATRAVLGTNAGESRGRLHAFNPNAATTIRVVASHHPRTLLDRPVLKAEAWKDLLLLEEAAS